MWPIGKQAVDSELSSLYVDHYCLIYNDYYLYRTLVLVKRIMKKVVCTFVKISG